MSDFLKGAIINLDLGKLTNQSPLLVCTSDIQTFHSLQICINYMQHLFADSECPVSVNITKVGHAFVLTSLHPFYDYGKKD